MSLIWGQKMNRSMHPPASIFVLQRSLDGGQSVHCPAGLTTHWPQGCVLETALCGRRGQSTRFKAREQVGSLQLSGFSSAGSHFLSMISHDSYTNPTCLPADGSPRRWICMDSQLMEHRELQWVVMSQSTLGTSPEWEFRTVSLKMKQ